jgi:heat shock factor-binding protein 1
MADDQQPSGAATSPQPQPQAQAAAGAAPSGQDLAMFVTNLLQQMQTKFEQMSDTILGRSEPQPHTHAHPHTSCHAINQSIHSHVHAPLPVDEMGTRIDDLEKSIGDLMQQAGVQPHDIPPQPSQPPKPK